MEWGPSKISWDHFRDFCRTPRHRCFLYETGLILDFVGTLTQGVLPNGKVFKQAYDFHESISKNSTYSTSDSTNKYDIDTAEIARRKKNQHIFTSVTYSFESRAWLNDDDHTIDNCQ